MTTERRPPPAAASGPTARKTCRDRAMPIQRSETLCALCALNAASPENSVGGILLNWLLFAALMGVIFGAGALLAP